MYIKMVVFDNRQLETRTKYIFQRTYDSNDVRIINKILIKLKCTILKQNKK